MSNYNVKDAILDRLDTYWVSTRIIEIENKLTDIGSSSDPWISLMFLGAPESQIGLGPAPTRYWRETGIVHFLIGVPAMTGWRTCDTYARQLGVLFRGVSLLNDDLVFGAVSPPQLYTQNQEILGNWFVKAILADYKYTYTDPT